ncbi:MULTISPECIES: thioredoxin domain-containing protein [unclassified Pantoea]|uniref:thioredoxin domain-containing protein n=1 Tax=unclassified Pantoea TaxID=2630326 RepID=UPI00301B6F94
MMKKLMTTFLLMGAASVTAATDQLWRQSEDTALSTHLAALPLASTPQVEALLQNKLLNDPLSPVVGATNPVLRIVSFVNYDCIHCQQFDVNLEKLLKAHPQIAITYKLISYGSGASTAATRMALTVWIEQPEKFHAFHRALMASSAMAGDERIHYALSTAGVKLSKYRPDTQHIIDMNKALLRKLHYSATPTTFIGDRVISGAVPYEELERAVTAALKDV